MYICTNALIKLNFPGCITTDEGHGKAVDGLCMKQPLLD